MRTELAVVAVVVASIACGGGDVVADRVEDAAGNKLTEEVLKSSGDLKDLQITDDAIVMTGQDGTTFAAGTGTKLPASWPAGVPDYGAPQFAADVPGAVAGKNDVTVMWQTSDTMQQVADKYTALETSGWTRGFMMNDPTMFGASWTSADGKTSLMVSASPDATVAGKTAVSATVNYLP